MSLNENEFYAEDRGGNYSDNYAQSRYLLYYLQECGLLRRYYHRAPESRQVEFPRLGACSGGLNAGRREMWRFGAAALHAGA